MTCEPPPEHRHRQWHWLRHAADQQWFVAEARNGFLWNGPRNNGAEEAYKRGWRYVAPADPPSVPDPPLPKRKLKGIRQ